MSTVGQIVMIINCEGVEEGKHQGPKVKAEKQPKRIGTRPNTQLHGAFLEVRESRWLDVKAGAAAEFDMVVDVDVHHAEACSGAARRQHLIQGLDQ